MHKVLMVVSGLWLAGCSAGAPSPSPEVWPTQGWTMSTPDAEGIDAALLAALDREFADGAHGQVTGLLVTRHGRVVLDRQYTHDFDRLFEGRDPVRGPYNYYDPDWHPYYQHGQLHTMQSVSKSITSALVGIAIGRGEMPPVDTPVMPLFASFRQPPADPRRDQMTLEHVLTMTTGIKWDESTVAYTDPANSCAGMERSADWIQFVLDQPMAETPGTGFVYNSGATELLSQLLKQGTGKHAHEYAAEHLFGPLGITDTLLEDDAHGPERHRRRPVSDRARPREDRLPLPQGRHVGGPSPPARGLGRPLDHADRRHPSGPTAVAQVRLPVVGPADGRGRHDRLCRARLRWSASHRGA